ncbi:MAG: SPFH domain-containing protein [Syntrophorhabdales bacterium]
MFSIIFFLGVLSCAIEAHLAKVKTGREGLVGETGVARTDIAPSGKVFVHGELWDAISEEEGRRCLMPIYLFILAVVVIFLAMAIKILREYERGVIFRLGRVLGRPKGPGLIILIPIIDRMVRVSLRTVVLEVPAQDVVTRDNVSIKVNAVVYFRVIDPMKAIIDVENFLYATSQLSQTTLRSVLGQAELDDLLSHREKINERLQEILDKHTEPWGIKVSNVEVKNVDLAQEMQRVIARQAEAERERRAKVISAEGEFQAATKLHEASDILSQNPMALQLRYLTTLVEISVEKSSTVIFPLPIDLVKVFTDKMPPK